MAANKQEYKEINNLQDQLNNSLRDENKLGDQIVDGSRKKLKIYNEIIEAGKEAIKQGKISAAQLAGDIDLMNELQGKDQDINKLRERRNKLLGYAEGFEQRGAIKTAGEAKRRAAVVDLEVQSLKTSEMRNAAFSSLDDLSGGILGKGKDFANTLGKWGPKVALTTAGLAAAVAILVQFSGKIDKIGETFGAVGLQSREVKSDLLGAEQEAARLGKSLEDVLTATTSLTDEFGIGFSEARKTASATIDMGVALGLSTGESAKLIGSFKTLVGLSTEQSIALAKNVTLLSTASDVAPQAVLKDLAGSSEQIALFTDASGENIARGAIQARKLGLEFSTLADSAKSLTNFQDTLSNALTAEVLTGKQINTNRLMRLSVEGDLEGLAKEQKKLLGDSAEFSKMDLFQREALAKAVGLTVDQAAKLVNKQEEAVTLAGALAGQPGFDDLVGTEGISTLTQMKGVFSSIAATLVNGLGPALNLVLMAIQSIVGAAELLIEITGVGSLLRVLGGQEAGYGKGVMRGLNTMTLGAVAAPTKVPSLDNEGFIEETGFAKVHAGESVGVFNSEGIINEVSSLKSEMSAITEALNNLELKTKITNKELNVVLSPTIG